MTDEIKIQQVSIADVDVFTDYKECPICNEPTQLIQETSGPLTDWTECAKCQNWFSPEVNFVEETDDDEDKDSEEETEDSSDDEGYF